MDETADAESESSHIDRVRLDSPSQPRRRLDQTYFGDVGRSRLIGCWSVIAVVPFLRSHAPTSGGVVDRAAHDAPRPPDRSSFSFVLAGKRYAEAAPAAI